MRERERVVYRERREYQNNRGYMRRLGWALLFFPNFTLYFIFIPPKNDTEYNVVKLGTNTDYDWVPSTLKVKKKILRITLNVTCVQYYNY